MKWICEADKLPPIAQVVLLAVPRQHGEFWDMKIARLLIAYEGVAPVPVPKGSRWPTQFWWGSGFGNKDTTLVTGNSWWTLLDEIELPPGAVHMTERGQHYIAQPQPIFVSQVTGPDMAKDGAANG